MVLSTQHARLAARMVLTAVLLCACGGTTATQGSGSGDAKAAGATVTSLAAGQLDALPTGTVYLQVNEFNQSPGAVTKSSKHVPAIVIQVAGVQRLMVEGSPPVDYQAGQAYFLASVTHSHLNSGPAANHWFNFALWPSAQRAAPPVPSARVAFATPDLPSDALPAGAYAISLQRVTLVPHGHTQAHKYGGIDVVFVMSGSISTHADGRSPSTLNADSGSYALAGTGLQEYDDSDQPATFVSFVIAAVGQPFETPLTRSL